MKKLQELRDNDIFQSVNKPSNSKWVSPMIVCPKRDRAVRVVVDMRQANVAREREEDPIPTVEEIL